MSLPKVNVYWFRKCLRLHDNEPLRRIAGENIPLLPIFIFDSKFLPSTRTEQNQEDCTGALSGQNQFQFLIECLEDLNTQLENMDSKLCIFVNQDTEDVFRQLLSTFDIQTLCFEKDTEPFAKSRDQRITEMMDEHSTIVHSSWAGHTLSDFDILQDELDGISPKTYKSFWPVVERISVPESIEPIVSIASLPANLTNCSLDLHNGVPSLTELGFAPLQQHCPFYGGETQALERMERKLSNTSWVCGFEKPKTSPASLQPSTTVLSPYLTLGCLSARYFYHRIQEIYNDNAHTQPPMSLHGQLYFREWFYYLSYTVPNFHQMEGNPLCLQVPWERDPKKIELFKQGQTGFPWIDAAMRQLRQEGWIHHLARHAVACFFTRGQLYQHWEEGKNIFAEYLIDGDYALNAANWMWLSSSAFFTAYFRVYGVESFPKKYDKAGIYVKKYCPELQDIPSKYIYHPWDAPLSIQRQAGCIIGQDYPHPMVDYKEAKNECMAKMKAAYANKQRGKPRGGARSSTSPASRTKKTTKSTNNKLPNSRKRKQTATKRVSSRKKQKVTRKQTRKNKAKKKNEKE